MYNGDSVFIDIVAQDRALHREHASVDCLYRLPHHPGLAHCSILQRLWADFLEDGHKERALRRPDMPYDADELPWLDSQVDVLQSETCACESRLQWEQNMKSSLHLEQNYYS